MQFIKLEFENYHIYSCIQIYEFTKVDISAIVLIQLIPGL